VIAYDRVVGLPRRGRSRPNDEPSDEDNEKETRQEAGDEDE
jgi:hypothetical protein